MRVAYFDCVAGVSGDMILGALLDAGLPEATLRERLAALRLDEFELRCQQVLKHGLRATQVDVVVADQVSARRLPEIETIVTESELPPAIKARAIGVFRRLGGVEATIHAATLEDVHLHELGGVDTIVDVVGALVGLDALGIERVYASPLPMGRGFVRSAHGPIPLPAPATLALLEGVPVVGSDLEVELVTPTGAALLSQLAAAFGPIPAMRLVSVGYGAGRRDLPIPNVLRLLVGNQAELADGSATHLGRESKPGDGLITETLVILETNIDDLNPEIYEYLMARLFDSGARDVFLTPIQMKKNRPATLVHVLCQPDHTETLIAVLFAETSTLGVRQQWVMRHCLARAIHTVETPYGQVRVKVASWGQDRVKVAPEYEDCRRLAEASGVPLREVYQAAQRAAEGLSVNHLKLS